MSHIEIKTVSKLRILYVCAFLVLLGMEVIIALFVHDQFIRPYMGDVLVVIVLYCLIRVIIPRKCRLLPVYVFLFASGVEVLQLLHIVELLGLQNNTFLRILVGSVFDIKDIFCYACGCVLLGLYEVICNNNIQQSDNKAS